MVCVFPTCNCNCAACTFNDKKLKQSLVDRIRNQTNHNCWPFVEKVQGFVVLKYFGLNTFKSVKIKEREIIIIIIKIFVLKN